MDLSQIVECDWNEARQRAEVVRPLIEFDHCSRDLAHQAAVELGLSERQVYRLIQRLRVAGGALTALVPGGSNGGRGKQRLTASREQLIQCQINDLFLTRQTLSAAELIRAICNQAFKAGITPPSESTIRRRLNALSLADKCRRGEEHPETRGYASKLGLIFSPHLNSK